MSGFRLHKLARHLLAREAEMNAEYRHGGDVGKPLYEFGQQEWCEAVAAHAVRLLELAADAGKLDLSKHQWGFSEEYTSCPQRLLGSQAAAGYWFMIRDGEVTGGVCPIPADCSALPGFHITAQWGLIAHASGIIFPAEALPKRMEDEAILHERLLIECRPPPSSHVAIQAGKPAFRTLDESFPPEIRLALRDNYVSELDGLHNFGANMMRVSPEVAFLPKSGLGVPQLQEMDDAERAEFYHLLERPLRPVYGTDLHATGAFGMPGDMAGKWEFGQREWCDACAEYGMQLLRWAAEAGELDLNAIQWGFSEEYMGVPARLAYTDRGTTMYWFMVKDGQISGGAGPEIPSECLEQPGFHIAAPWALIAGPSGGIYGPVGSALRSYHFAILEQQVRDAGKSQTGGEIVFKRPAGKQPFPPAISAALRDRPEFHRAGLHNFAAYSGSARSPELQGLPETSSFCVDLARCTEAQKRQFFQALGRAD